MTAAARAERWQALAPELPPDAPARLEDLLDEIIRWNQRIRLTAPASRDELAFRIVDDSLALLPFVVGSVLIDIGSGPGVPALPIAIARPGLQVRTVEAIAKKVAFTRAFLARHSDLRVQPFHGRAAGKSTEPWAPGDTVVSRALTAPTEWIPLGAPLVREGGRLLVTLGAGTGEEGDAPARELGLHLGGFQSVATGEAKRGLRWYQRRNQ
jgi:16S rRNA (guanine527-N7)-methyltransferase